MEYESRLREMDEKHQHQLQELENAYQQNIMGEVERYQVMPCASRGLIPSLSLNLQYGLSSTSPYRMRSSFRLHRHSCKREICSRIGGKNSNNSSFRLTKSELQGRWLRRWFLPNGYGNSTAIEHWALPLWNTSSPTDRSVHKCCQ